MKYIRSVQVSRRENGNYWVHWTPDFTNTAVTVYAGDHPEQLKANAPVAEGVRDSVEVSNSHDGRRRYFHLQADDGASMTVAERLLPLEGGVNFRDCGGYPAADGRRVKWNHLYRSGYMSRLSPADANYLRALGIRVCCDFRGLKEQQSEPSLLPESTSIISLTVEPGNLNSYLQMASQDDSQNHHPDMSEMMVKLNLLLVEEHTAQYGSMLEQLLLLEEGAFMVNCSAGKDRTGFGVALILMALGVPRDAVMHDYLLSRKYFDAQKEMNRLIAKYSESSGALVNEELMLPMLDARESYLGAALDHIQREYGRPEQYLQQKFSIDASALETLRARFTV